MCARAACDGADCSGSLSVEATRTLLGGQVKTDEPPLDRLESEFHKLMSAWGGAEPGDLDPIAAGHDGPRPTSASPTRTPTHAIY